MECARRGAGEVVVGCIGLLSRRDPDALIFAIVGPGARSMLDGGQQY